MVRSGAWILAVMLVAGAAGLPGRTALAVTLNGGGWAVGSLGVETEPADDPSNIVPWRGTGFAGALEDKLRLSGMSFVGGWLTVRPWVAQTSLAGASRSMSGLLIDLPFGDFSVTPSIGAELAQRVMPGTGSGLEFRSQLEVGYAFDEGSRLTLGFSRSGGPARMGTASSSDDVFALRYRLSFGQ